MRKYSVIISGASTGIGRATAIRLQKNGHQVFPGVRKESDTISLKEESPSFHPLILDVTSPESIASAHAEFLRFKIASNPVALVNNAGVAIPGPIEAMTSSQLRRQFDVNVFGLVGLTQALLPMIRETQGRIINMSSISGVIATPLFGGYAASKFAVEAISDSLRREVRQFGVKVISIEPGVIKTPIWEKGYAARESIRSEMREESLRPYQKHLETLEQSVMKIAELGIPADEVAIAVEKALNHKNPPVRMRVLSTLERMQVALAETLPTEVVDRILEKQIFRV